MIFVVVLWKCSEENKFDVGFSITKGPSFKVHLKYVCFTRRDESERIILEKETP